MNRTRLAMWGDGSAFKRAVSELERQIGDAPAGRSERVADAWAELREIGRR